jgi:LacI family fructose operon transcriptional repressor
MSKRCERAGSAQRGNPAMPLARPDTLVYLLRNRLCRLCHSAETDASRSRTSMPKPKSTIYDLAELAEVSASTVSAVLNGNWKERRIAESTAQKVQRLAAKHMYSINRQASGLRKSRSGLTAMIIPLHDNRFFSGMAQAFERLARERRWHPLVVSTLRDPALELETVKTISYRIEHLL